MFLEQLEEVLVTVDGSVIERGIQISDAYVQGFAELGCFGMENTDRVWRSKECHKLPIIVLRCWLPAFILVSARCYRLISRIGVS